MKPADIANMSEKGMAHKDVMKYFSSSLASAEQIAAYLQTAPRGVKEKYAGGINSLGGLENFEVLNYGGAKYLGSNAGMKALGIKIKQSSSEGDNQENNEDDEEEEEVPLT